LFLGQVNPHCPGPVADRSAELEVSQLITVLADHTDAGVRHQDEGALGVLGRPRVPELLTRSATGVVEPETAGGAATLPSAE